MNPNRRIKGFECPKCHVRLKVPAEFIGRRGECKFSGFDALEQIERRTPGILALGLMMPGMDGLEVLKHMRIQGIHASVFGLQ
ncbi:hypothetical protein ACFL1X_07920 [Candidatus Hydrogenedentota bacterium]